MFPFFLVDNFPLVAEMSVKLVLGCMLIFRARQTTWKKKGIESFLCGVDLLSSVLFDTITVNESVKLFVSFALCHICHQICCTTISTRCVCPWAEILGIRRYLEKRLCIKSTTKPTVFVPVHASSALWILWATMRLCVTFWLSNLDKQHCTLHA